MLASDDERNSAVLLVANTIVLNTFDAIEDRKSQQYVLLLYMEVTRAIAMVNKMLQYVSLRWSTDDYVGIAYEKTQQL